MAIVQTEGIKIMLGKTRNQASFTHLYTVDTCSNMTPSTANCPEISAIFTNRTLVIQ